MIERQHIAKPVNIQHSAAMHVSSAGRNKASPVNILHKALIYFDQEAAQSKTC